MPESERFENRFGQFLDTVDAKSRRLENSIKNRLQRKKDNDIKEQNITELSLEKTAKRKTNSPEDESKIKGLDLQNKLDVLKEKSSKFFNIFSNKMNSIWTSLPFLIPSIVMFQTALWLAYLSENSMVNEIVQNRVNSLGEAGKSIALLLTFFGAIGGYLLSSSFDNNSSYGEFSLLPEVVDVMGLLLVLSSVLYCLKKSQSLYYFYLVIFGSIVIRLVEVELSSYNFISIIVQMLGLTLFSTLLSSPILSHSRSLKDKESRIDTSMLELDSPIPTEYSYHDPFVDNLGISMDQAPVSKPRRPSRRSEYELYEWVLLLANLILWPSVVTISIILGSGTEVAGGTYNLEENYLMLVGPLLLTIFFFTLLYKMDSNARDGSLYQAEKQSYLDEMEKYLEARTAYLELVTLQAQMKKDEMINPSSEE